MIVEQLHEKVIIIAIIIFYVTTLAVSVTLVTKPAHYAMNVFKPHRLPCPPDLHLFIAAPSRRPRLCDSA